MFRIRIRMDPGFFADPDPGFKSPDPDPSIKKFIRSKWWFWWGYGEAWPKKTVLRVLDMKYNIFFYFYPSFRTFFFHWSGSGFFRIGSGFLADPDPDSEKKSDPDPGKKNPDPKHWIIIFPYTFEEKQFFKYIFIVKELDPYSEHGSRYRRPLKTSPTRIRIRNADRKTKSDKLRQFYRIVWGLESR